MKRAADERKQKLTATPDHDEAYVVNTTFFKPQKAFSLEVTF
jgi:hypothetical protein